MVALTVVNQVEHIGREAEPVAKLFDKDTEVDDQQAGGQRIGEVDIDDVGQCDGHHHGPEPPLQSVAAGHHATEDAAQRQSDNPHRALHQSVFHIRETETAIAGGIDEEQCRHLGQQALRHPVEEHEADGDPHLRLLEEGHHRGHKLPRYLAHGAPRLVAVLIGMRQCPAVVEPQGDEESGHEIEH